jgi:hypothetical protein
MSTTTSSKGRSRSVTETSAPPGKCRKVRWAPGTRGGDRNAGTASPAERAAAPRQRAVSVKRTAGDASFRLQGSPPIPLRIALGCDAPAVRPGQPEDPPRPKPNRSVNRPFAACARPGQPASAPACTCSSGPPVTPIANSMHKSTDVERNLADVRAELADVRAESARARIELDAVRAELADMRTRGARPRGRRSFGKRQVADPREASPHVVSRRRLFGLLSGAAAAGAGLAVAGSSLTATPASAGVDGDVILGQTGLNAGANGTQISSTTRWPASRRTTPAPGLASSARARALVTG